MDLSRLNPAQREAVLFGDDPLLVLAGAGSGKTTVITYRLANLVHARGVEPEKILAVTFTNKAAREMRERAAKLIGREPKSLDIGTFHGMCGRLLRRYGPRLGLTPSFVIYDADDQLALVRRCLTDLMIDPQAFSPQAIRHKIEHWKNQGDPPGQAEASAFDLVGKRALEVYKLYAQRCLEHNAVDFGDLLLHTVRLLKHDADVKGALRARWSHILVDEYQDTNHVQYLLLSELCTPKHSLTVVGDDDQSIYRWRGADIGNILRFERDFPGAQIVRLEQNYRSTGTILAAANAVIAHNASRKGKTLFTNGERGAPLELRLFAHERDEGEAVGDAIARHLERGVAGREIAVLYRTNAQSRPIEDALRRRKLAYAVYGGVRFYDRREIKDALAYLRLIVNPRSDIDFLRVVNAPARGIGKTSLEKLLELAQSKGTTLFAAARLVQQGDDAVSGKARKGLAEFVVLMDELTAASASPELGRFLERVLDDTGYLEDLKLEGTEEAQDRVDNLAELVAALDEYAELTEEPTLAGFLEEAALASDIDEGAGEKGGLISLMTLHTAKGLEFEVVFLPGMEEGLFPHSRSLSDRPALEEERRLCYVGLTRAKRFIHLSAARSRVVFGEPTLCELSRFVTEIPSELLSLGESARPLPEPRHAVEHFPEPPPVHGDEPVYERPRAPSGGSFSPGTRVFHASFGEGRVLDSEGEGPRQKLTVEFASVGRKVIVARFVERR